MCPACLLNGLLWVELLYRAEHARYQLSWEGEGRRKSAYGSSWALRHVFPLGSVGTPLCICCNKHCLEVQGAGSCEVFYEIFVHRVVLGTNTGNSVSTFLSPSTHVVGRYQVCCRGNENKVWNGGSLGGHSHKFTDSLMQEPHFYICSVPMPVPCDVYTK